MVTIWFLQYLQSYGVFNFDKYIIVLLKSLPHSWKSTFIFFYLLFVYFFKNSKNYVFIILAYKFWRFRLFQRGQLISTCHYRYSKVNIFNFTIIEGLQDNFVRLPLFFEFWKFQTQIYFFDNFCVQIVSTNATITCSGMTSRIQLVKLKLLIYFTHNYNRILVCMKWKECCACCAKPHRLWIIYLRFLCLKWSESRIHFLNPENSLLTDTNYLKLQKKIIIPKFWHRNSNAFVYLWETNTSENFMIEGKKLTIFRVNNIRGLRLYCCIITSTWDGVI